MTVSLGCIAMVQQETGPKPLPSAHPDSSRSRWSKRCVNFELANRRVVDLTQRLIDATEERRTVRTELELLRIEHGRTPRRPITKR